MLSLQVLKGGMVSDYHEWLPFEVDTPDLQRMNDGKEFLLMDGVVDFCRGKLARFVGNWLISMPLVLTEYCAYGGVRGICCDLIG